MSRQTNKTLIGGFVVGAIALMVAGVLIFGSGKFLAERPRFVMYFEGSVNGLNIGAPVVFRGVKIGSVTDIVMLFDPADMSVKIPVFIETDPRTITRVGEVARQEPEKVVSALIERGMRAQLQMQNLVTGQLMIALDINPDKPARLVGVDTEYMEIPTIPSSMEELSKTIEKLPLDELAQKLTSAIAGIERAVNAPEVGESLRTVNQTLKDIQTLVRDIDSRIEPLASTMEETVKDYGKLARDVDAQVEPLMSGITETVKDTRKLVQNLDSRIAPLQSSIQSTAKAAAAAIAQANKTIGTLEGVAGEDSTLVYQITKTLEELSSAARSIRVWADYLERHPEALIRGKGGGRR
jgi:paraquat-inducible protein B